jgi:chromosome segregation ATPase
VEARHKKEIKSLKKEADRVSEEMTKNHLAEVEKLQSLHKEQV